MSDIDTLALVPKGSGLGRCVGVGRSVLIREGRCLGYVLGWSGLGKLGIWYLGLCDLGLGSVFGWRLLSDRGLE